MAWSWSHSVEAYSNVRENIANLHRSELEVIYAEWMTCISENSKMKRDASRWGFTYYFNINLFDSRSYYKALFKAKELDSECMAERIYDWAEEHATCDNGGWNAWVCPSCCHRVSFDLEDNDE